jgi:hypothetical protein
MAVSPHEGAQLRFHVFSSWIKLSSSLLAHASSQYVAYVSIVASTWHHVWSVGHAVDHHTAVKEVNNVRRLSLEPLQAHARCK